MTSLKENECFLSKGKLNIASNLKIKLKQKIVTGLASDVSNFNFLKNSINNQQREQETAYIVL